MKNTRTAIFVSFLLTLGLTVPALAVDSDGDGVDDTLDNCSELPNPDQRDTNGDGFGNACDADLNNDLIVNSVDLGMLRSVFFQADDDADANGDGTVNSIDLGALGSQFFGPPGPGAVTPPGYNQRPYRYEVDFDNNGIADGVSQIVYDANGNVEQQLYNVSDDGTADLITFTTDVGFQADYGYTNGVLTSIDQDNFTASGNDFAAVYQYDANGVLERSDDTVFAASGTVLAELYTTFHYLNGLRIRDDLFQSGSNTLLLTRNHVYDANGMLATSSWLNQLSPGGVEFDFDWNVDGKLIRKRTDIDADGVFDEVVIYTHQGGRLQSRTVTGSLSVQPPNFTETPIYDANGRVNSLEYDANSDGSVDGVATILWENGPCVPLFVPGELPTGGAGADGDPLSGVGDVLMCAP